VSLTGHSKATRLVFRQGAGLVPFTFLVLLVSWACGSQGGSELGEEDLERRELGLMSGAEIHRVSLGGRGSEEHSVPTVVQAVPGDAIEFRTVDHRVHTVSFLLDSLTAGVREYLEGTDQTASPPLVRRGDRFIVRLQDAPVGEYIYVTEGHGGRSRGVVVVSSPSDDGVGS
jgi:plastocyanin